MYIEIAIAKYTPIFSILAGVAVILKAVPGVPGISERVGGVAEQIPLQLYISLQVGVLGEGEVSKGEVV